MLDGARLDAIFFTILGIFAGAFIFAGCFLFGWTGESITARLRQQLFTHIIYQVFVQKIYIFQKYNIWRWHFLG